MNNLLIEEPEQAIFFQFNAQNYVLFMYEYFISIHF